MVEQWEVSHDFFVLLEGEAEVLVDGAVVGRLLGAAIRSARLGALDWERLRLLAHGVRGRGVPLRLLAFADGSSNELMRRVPAVRSSVLAIVAERLPEG